MPVQILQIEAREVAEPVVVNCDDLSGVFEQVVILAGMFRRYFVYTAGGRRQNLGRVSTEAGDAAGDLPDI